MDMIALIVLLVFIFPFFLSLRIIFRIFSTDFPYGAYRVDMLHKVICREHKSGAGFDFPTPLES